MNDDMIDKKAREVFDMVAARATDDDMRRLRAAFSLAREAHASQFRKGGDPYILHPIAVAAIVAGTLCLDVNSVIAAFLHDVVEDTPVTIDEIRDRFGDDVASIVSVVTKPQKDHYDATKQVDNYRQMLASLKDDVRPILVKLADRLHNMRTLADMRPDKQMKIAGETDYLYAPLATRLGLYDIKTELENLSFRFRCPHEFEEITSLIQRDRDAQRIRLDRFNDQLREVLKNAGIKATVFTEYRRPYSVWRKMHKYGDDFNHLKYRHFTEIIFPSREPVVSDKEMALRVYSALTDRFKEKPGGISNYIDSPKENGYQSFHVKLLPDFGRWQEVHIASDKMYHDSALGCVANRNEQWLEKFREVLRDIPEDGRDGSAFIADVVASFYNDDIMTFTSAGTPVVLPQRSTVLDFAYEVDEALGSHAKYARINGFLSSIKAPLRRGDVVEVFTDEKVSPSADWLNAVTTYKARKAVSDYLVSQPRPRYDRCPHCLPIPGEEVIGFFNHKGDITLHKRDCPTAVSMASQFGDSIVSVDYEPDQTLYPVTIEVTAVDRFHLFIDLVDTISNTLNLAIDTITTTTTDSIVKCRISFGIHSFGELQTIIHHIALIDGVDEVKRLV